MSSAMTKSQCWRCHATREPNWAFCPGCGARLIDTRNASPPNPPLDVSFLYDLYSFGWYNHHISAVALYDAGATITRFYEPESLKEHFCLEVEPPCAQSILRAKIFAEYVALLETFGVLCVAITKLKQQSLMWTYLNTEPQDVAQFYDRVLALGPKSLERLLKLPSLSFIKKAIASGFKRTLPGWPNDTAQFDTQHVIYDYVQQSQNIVQMAKSYRESENVRIYNKIKHVFPMVNGQNWLHPPLDPHYVAFAINDSGLLARLPMTPDEVEREVNEIFQVMRIGLELMALYLSLYRVGAL